jgi:lysyl-tRNA synthetase class I
MDLDISNPEVIKQLIASLQTLLPPEDKPKEKKPAKNSHNIKTKTTKSGRQNTEEATNKFLDMPEKNMHKSDSKIDKKLNRYPPTPRNRPYQSIEVRCRSCGKTESVNPKILPESADRYKCNKCSSSPGA